MLSYSIRSQELLCALNDLTRRGLPRKYDNSRDVLPVIESWYRSRYRWLWLVEQWQSALCYKKSPNM